jgi:membrane protein
MAEEKKPTLLERVLPLWDPVHLRSWSLAHRKQPGVRAFLVKQLEVFILTARSVVQEELTLRAAALTYNTLLSIVPLLAVGFALFKAFGGLQKIEGPLRQFVIENLAVGRAQDVGQWLDHAVRNISAGAIAGVGVLMLFYSAMGLLTNIEGSINHIWGSRRSRPIYIRFAIYWCLITLAPPLLGFSVSFSAKLQSSAYATAVLGWLPFGIGRWLMTLGSAFSVCIAFVLVYLIVPTAKVRLRAALLGGTVAGVLWSVSKYVFIVVSAGTLKYSAVYGALGVLPLLMMWIYVSWLIVLFGATYTFANQSVSTDSLEVVAHDVRPALREALAVRLAATVAGAFHVGRKPPTAEELAERVGAPLALVRRILATLVTHQLLIETSSESDPGYVLGRDPQETTVAQIIEVLRQKDGVTPTLSAAPLHDEICRLLEQAEEAGGKVLGAMSLRALAQRAAETS